MTHTKLYFYVIDRLIREYVEQEGITSAMRDIFLTITTIYSDQVKKVKPMMGGGDEDENIPE